MILELTWEVKSFNLEVIFSNTEIRKSSKNRCFSYVFVRSRLKYNVEIEATNILENSITKHQPKVMPSLDFWLKLTSFWITFGSQKARK